jgi:hypothetical protein
MPRLGPPAIVFRTFESRNSIASDSVSSASEDKLTTKSSEPSKTDWRGVQQASVFIGEGAFPWRLRNCLTRMYNKHTVYAPLSQSEDAIAMQVGQKVRELRVLRGLTQRSVADKRRLQATSSATVTYGTTRNQTFHNRITPRLSDDSPTPSAQVIRQSSQRAITQPKENRGVSRGVGSTQFLH